MLSRSLERYYDAGDLVRSRVWTLKCALAIVVWYAAEGFLRMHETLCCTWLAAVFPACEGKPFYCFVLALARVRELS